MTRFHSCYLIKGFKFVNFKVEHPYNTVQINESMIAAMFDHVT